MSSPAVIPFYNTKQGATPLTKNEAQSFCRSILNSQKYRDSVRDRAQAGKLAPAVEIMLWHYGYGKPAEQVNVTHNIADDLTGLPLEELQRRAQLLHDQIAETVELARAIPADILDVT